MDPVTLAIVEGIISALIVSGGGFLIIRSRSRLRARRELVKVHKELAERLLSSGVSNFYVGRQDWHRYRRPPALDAYLRQASESVQIASFWMAQGSIEGIPKVCRDLATQGRRIEIVLINPNGPLPEILSRDLELPAETIRAQVLSSLDSLKRLQDGLASADMPNFNVKVSDSLPQAAVILLDAGRPTGKIQLELRPYRAARSDSFSIEVCGDADAQLYKILRESWVKFFQDAQPVVRAPEVGA